MECIRESRETGIYGTYDVIVVGGGVAGVAAALAAARNNAKVLLLEKQAVLGGLATAGHVVYYDPICDGMGHKIYSGITEELFNVSIKYGYSTLPDEWRGGPWKVDNSSERYQTVFNGPAFVMALDELVLGAGIDILLDTVFCDVEMEDGLCKAVIVENKSGRQAYRCKAVVDASGDADVLYRAGAPCSEGDNHVTYWAYCTSDHNDEISGITGPPPKNIKVMIIGNFRGSDLPPDISKSKYKGTDVRHVTEFLLKSRKAGLGKIQADPSLVFTSFPSQAQFRTTRKLNGEHTLRTENAGKHFPDSIGCASIWNIPKPVYEIPFGTLTTKSIRNIFAAGRIVSCANGHAWEITRPIPACALTGQAAGSAAAIYSAHSSEVPISELQAVLKRDGVMLTMSETMVKQSEQWLEDWRKQEDPFYKDISD
jgi:hypothetical protein